MILRETTSLWWFCAVLFFLLSSEHLHAFTVKIRDIVLILLLIHPFIYLQHKTVLPRAKWQPSVVLSKIQIPFVTESWVLNTLQSTSSPWTVSLSKGLNTMDTQTSWKSCLDPARPRSVGSTVLILRAISNLTCSNWVLRNGLLKNIRKGHPGWM